MRVGLLGLGRIGMFHATTLSTLVDDLVVSDADLTRAEEVAGRLGARVGDPFDADAVVIATPTSTHAEALLRACDRGVPAFCEKPAAPTVAETQRVREAVRRGGVAVHIGFQRRFDAGYVAAREAPRAALVKAVASARTTVVHVETVPGGGSGAQAWWDVPIAEVSGLAGTRAAREHYGEAKRDQRPYL